MEGGDDDGPAACVASCARSRRSVPSSSHTSSSRLSSVLVEDVVEGLVEMEEATDLVEIKQEGDGARALVVARLDAASRVRPDEPLELSVDPRRLHFFDLDSGSAIGA